MIRSTLFVFFKNGQQQFPQNQTFQEFSRRSGGGLSQNLNMDVDVKYGSGLGKNGSCFDKNSTLNSSVRKSWFILDNRILAGGAARKIELGGFGFSREIVFGGKASSQQLATY